MSGRSRRGASVPFATITGVTFWISARRASSSGICRLRFFPIDMTSASPPVRRDAEDTEPLVVALRTTSCRSRLSTGATPNGGRATDTAEASALPKLTCKHPTLSWREDCHGTRIRLDREAMGSSDALLPKRQCHIGREPCCLAWAQPLMRVGPSAPLRMASTAIDRTLTSGWSLCSSRSHERQDP